MTCILAAVLDDGRTVVLGDRLTTDGRSIGSTRKLWRCGGWVFGYAGGLAESQLFARKFKSYLQGLKGTLTRDALLEVHDAICEDARLDGGVHMLAARSGEILDLCYGSDERRRGFHAIGCGADLAIGALAALAGRAAPSLQQVRQACAIASRFDLCVGRRFDLEVCL